MREGVVLWRRATGTHRGMVKDYHEFALGWAHAPVMSATLGAADLLPPSLCHDPPGQIQGQTKVVGTPVNVRRDASSSPEPCLFSATVSPDGPRVHVQRGAPLEGPRKWRGERWRGEPELRVTGGE